MKVGILGASGYTGSELLRILAKHPEAEVTVATSRALAGKPIWVQHPFLKGFYDLEFVEPELKHFDDCDVVFTAVPHGEAMKYVPELLDMGLKVVDLSADYRLDKETYERVYGREHVGYRSAVYGLTELHRDEVAKADLVANPGCYPTGAILAVAPIAERAKRVVFDAKSGITGAGAKPTEFTHYPNLHEAIVPYKVNDHRHYWEIAMELRRFNPEVVVSFTPQVFPGSRGILTNAHVFMDDVPSREELYEIYRKFYEGCFFVRLQESVRLSWVRGSNFCDIAIFVDERDGRVIVCSAIDNLVKGASGQAVQNMNVMFGLDERTGLDFPPLFP